MDRKEKEWYESAGRNTKNLENPYDKKASSDIGAITMIILIIVIIWILVAVLSPLFGIHGG